MNNYNDFNNQDFQINRQELEMRIKKTEERKQSSNNRYFSILFVFVVLFFAFLTIKSLYIKQTYEVTNATIIEISDIRTERKIFAKSNRNNKNVYMDITLQTINDETIFLDDEKIDFGKKNISKGQNMELYYKGNNYELGENLNSRIMVNGVLTIIFTIITIISFGATMNNKKNTKKRVLKQTLFFFCFPLSTSTKNVKIKYSICKEKKKGILYEKFRSF